MYYSAYSDNLQKTKQQRQITNPWLLRVQGGQDYKVQYKGGFWYDGTILYPHYGVTKICTCAKNSYNCTPKEKANFTL